MHKLFATLKKDALLLTRDKLGLLFMFGMPIVLAILITAVQNSTFDLVNNNKIALLLYNADTGSCSKQFILQIEKSGSFDITRSAEFTDEKQFNELMSNEDAIVGITIPSNFTERVKMRSNELTKKIISDLGITVDTTRTSFGDNQNARLTVFFNPVLQETFRHSIRGAVNGALQLVENKQLLKQLYTNFNEKAIPDSLEKMMTVSQTNLNEITVSRSGLNNIPNATQHNIPAWTVFAMFFVVISLGSNIVKEKLNGSFLRLKTLPSSFAVSLLSKQITYLVVTTLQAFIIFMIGVFLFPMMHLPKLILPASLSSLVLITLVSGWCAVSYALCVGIFSRTQEQANGFGAVTVVILAAIGGILVPSFAMPNAFISWMIISPLHWCLESYYALFLKQELMTDILWSLAPIGFMILLLQTLALMGLKHKQLI